MSLSMEGEPKVEPTERYHEQATVNGIEIRIDWDEDFEGYEIYFPQIRLEDEASERGVSDQVIKTTQSPKLAKEVFDFATQQAQTEKDVYSLYKKVEAFSQDLPYNEEV